MANAMSEKRFSPKTPNDKGKTRIRVGTLVTFKSTWEHRDEARFHAFIRGIDLSHFIREAFFFWIQKHRSRDMTIEQQRRLDAIGGWPSREEQEKRLGRFKGKNCGKGFNEWLWERKVEAINEPTDGVDPDNPKDKS